MTRAPALPLMVTVLSLLPLSMTMTSSAQSRTLSMLLAMRSPSSTAMMKTERGSLGMFMRLAFLMQHIQQAHSKRKAIPEQNARPVGKHALRDYERKQHHGKLAEGEYGQYAGMAGQHRIAEQ